MKRALLPALLLAGLTAPAAAQFPPDRECRVIESRGRTVMECHEVAPRRVEPSWRNEERSFAPGYYGRDDRYGRRGGFDRYEDDDFYDERPRRRGRDRRAATAICVTSRGNCDAGLLSAGAPCRCMIPGFGQKRGQVVHR